MVFKSSKINEFRLWGLLLTLGGMGLMILGLVGIVYQWGEIAYVIAFIALIIGMICMLGSVAVYMWAGMLSTTARIVECPSCGKHTKVLGKTDRCMLCHSILSFDPKYKEAEQSTTEES